MWRLAMLALVGCGAAPPPIESFRDARLAYSIRLSPDESLAALIVDGGSYDGETEVELRQRRPDQRLLAKSGGPATLIGTPTNRDALILDRTPALRWLRGGQSATVDVAEDARVIGSTADHAGHRALVAFARTDRIVIVEYDTTTLVETAREQVLEGAPASCVAAGTGHTLYVTCPGGADVRTESWIITRFEGARSTWTVSVGLPPERSGAMLAAMTGDGSALVLLHGTGETSRIRFAPQRAVFVDPARGGTRIVALGGAISHTSELVPVPSRPQVACVRWTFSTFEGIAVIDAVTRELSFPVAELASEPQAFAPLASGRFLVGQ